MLRQYSAVALITETDNRCLENPLAALECVVLAAREGVPPSAAEPVRIFLGSERAQHRAERVFVWSIEQVRDPARVYEIYLMKDLPGFDRRKWLTGFTNYRFAIPHLAGGRGRAIYNDVDQIYLADPAQLFDTEMDGHGYLAVSDRDTSVMLIDCERLSTVWPLVAAQRERRKQLEARARALPGLWGPLQPGWNARDEEYAAHRSRLLHYTTIHAQPWQPFPRRYAYQRNPHAQVWLDLEHGADAARYQVFTAANPSRRFQALAKRWRAVQVPGCAESAPLSQCSDEVDDGLAALVAAAGARRLVDFSLAGSAEGLARLLGEGCSVTLHELLDLTMLRGHCDGVLCLNGLDYLPDEDVPWMLDVLFEHAQCFVFVMVRAYASSVHLADDSELRSLPGDRHWWSEQFERAGGRHPHLRWRLLVHERDQRGRVTVHVREAGRVLSAAPTVWVLADDKPGHNTQALGLAQSLGWPCQIKELHFNRLNLISNHLLGASLISLKNRPAANLEPPWPDLVIATGRRSAPVARWIADRSHGRTRLVHLGRKGGEVAAHFDLTVTCAHFRLPYHPRRIETVAPLNPVIAERLTQAAERWSGLFDGAPAPRVALLIGGSSALHRLDAVTAAEMAAAVCRFAEQAGGSVFAITSPRTSQGVIDALCKALVKPHQVHVWRRDERDNPYQGCLALADVLVVTGESESMLAEAAASGKPMYIYTVPEASLSLLERVKEQIIGYARKPRLNKRGTVRPQKGLQFICAWLVEHGLIKPRRDLKLLHKALIERGVARFFGEPFAIEQRLPLMETEDVAQRVRALFGLRGR